jgi:glycosyltransferase involved in cell wall biosynthesis
METFDFLIVATADWDNPLWTNKQHLASRLGAAGHRVLYVESLGLRKPGASRRDIGRMWRRLRRANRLRRVVGSVWVLSPLVIPLHDSRLVRRANRSIIRRGIGRALRRIGMARPILWTYNPLVLELLEGVEWSALVYHCVDELAGSPGMPTELLERAERELCRRADLVVASAPALAKSRREFSKRLEYVPNVADFENFVRAADPETPVAADLEAIPPPRIGFVGAISNYKLDLELLEEVLRSRPDWSLVMVGPVGGGDPGTRADSLEELPNVHLLGIRRREELPGYLKGFDVCLLPNRINRYTSHMFPLKFFEYLATGRPVVMTPLPSLEEFRHLAFVAEAYDPPAFERAIESALDEPAEAPVRKRRVEEARKHDWSSQVERLTGLVREVLGAERAEAGSGRKETGASP